MVGRQKRHRNAVEARSGKALVGRPEEFRVAAQIVQRTGRTRQRARNGHGKHDVALVLDARIACGEAVGTTGLELVAEGGARQNDKDDDRQNDGHDDAAVDLGIRKEHIQAHFGGGDIVEGGFIDVAALGVLHHVLEIGDVKDPCHKVGCDPVGHDAGQHLVDVEQRLEHARNGTPQRARQHAAEEGQEPNDFRRDDRGRNAQRDEQRGRGACQVLSRSADVEQPGLERHRHGKASEDQRRGAEEHVAHTGGIKAKGKRARRITARGEQAAKDQANPVPYAFETQRGGAQTHDQNNQTARDQAHQNGQDRRHDRPRTVLMP